MKNLFTIFLLIQITFIYSQNIRNIHLLDNDRKSDFGDKINFDDDQLHRRYLFSSNNRFRLGADSFHDDNVIIVDTQLGNRWVWDAGISTFLDYTVGTFKLSDNEVSILATDGFFYPTTLWKSQFKSPDITPIEFAKRLAWTLLISAYVLNGLPADLAGGQAELALGILTSYTAIDKFVHRYHNELILSDVDGHIEIYHVDDWFGLNDNFTFDKLPSKQLIFSTRDNKHRLLHDDFTSLEAFVKDVFPGYDVVTFLETDEEENRRKLIITPDENWFLLHGKIFSTDDLIDQHGNDGEKNTVSIKYNPIIDLFKDIIFSTTGGYFDINSSGEVEIIDLDGDVVKDKKGSDCIHINEEKYHFYLEENSNQEPILRMYSKNKFPLWHMGPDHKVVCDFPESGQNSLTTSQKLTQFNQKPANKDEPTYLLSADGKKITIKDGNKLKVIEKSQFNGDFRTSPTIQTFNLD